MTANVNPVSGIRYGVVALSSLAGWAYDEFLYKGQNVSAEDAFDDWAKRNPGATEQDRDRFWEEYEECEDTYTLKTEDGLRLMLSYLGGAPLVWVLDSPVTARARLCSPCIPNAGDLDNQSELGHECYTLPPEWWEKES